MINEKLPANFMFRVCVSNERKNALKFKEGLGQDPFVNVFHSEKCNGPELS